MYERICNDNDVSLCDSARPLPLYHFCPRSRSALALLHMMGHLHLFTLGQLNGFVLSAPYGWNLIKI